MRRRARGRAAASGRKRPLAGACERSAIGCGSCTGSRSPSPTASDRRADPDRAVAVDQRPQPRRGLSGLARAVSRRGRTSGMLRSTRSRRRSGLAASRRSSRRGSSRFCARSPRPRPSTPPRPRRSTRSRRITPSRWAGWLASQSQRRRTISRRCPGSGARPRRACCCSRSGCATCRSTRTSRAWDAPRAVSAERAVRGDARRDARDHATGRRARVPSEPAPPRPADVPRAPPRLRRLRPPEDVPERVQGGVTRRVRPRTASGGHGYRACESGQRVECYYVAGSVLD